MSKVQGNGLAVAFGTTGWTPNIKGFTKSGESADDVLTTDFATVGEHTYQGGVVREGGTYAFPFDVDPTITTRPTTGVTEQITVTYPVSVPGNTAATDTFPGYINSYDTETEPNVLYAGTFVIKVAGAIVSTDEFTP